MNTRAKSPSSCSLLLVGKKDDTVNKSSSSNKGYDEKKGRWGWGGELRARGEGSGKSSQRRRPEGTSHMRTGGKVKSRMDKSFIFKAEII